MIRARIPKILGSRVAIHAYLWLLYIAIMIVEPYDDSISLGRIFLRNAVFVATLIPPVYIHFSIFDRYFSKGHFRTYAPLTAATAIVFGGANYLVLTRYHQMDSSFLFSSVYVLVFLAITTALKTAKAWYDQRLVIKEIQAQHLQTELQFLKSQINPHFLFNTLNNLYGIISKRDQKAAQGIATLSSLMRYMIHDSNVMMIDLNKELEQVRRFIELQRLRFSEDDDIIIKLSTDGNVSGVTLPPMLLLPFVENAFKHGISLSSPSHVVIDLHVWDNTLHLSVKNSVHGRSGRNDTNTEGIGLRNVKRRLALLYGDRHELNVTTNDGEYAISLTIQLLER